MYKFVHTEPVRNADGSEPQIIKSGAKSLPVPDKEPKLTESGAAPELAPPSAVAKLRLSKDNVMEDPVEAFKKVFEKECGVAIDCSRLEQEGEAKIAFQVPIAFELADLNKTGITDLNGVQKHPLEGWFVPKEVLAKHFDGLDVDNPDAVTKRLQEHKHLQNAQVNYDHYDKGLVLVTGMALGTQPEEIFPAELAAKIVKGEPQEAVMLIPEGTLVPFGSLHKKPIPMDSYKAMIGDPEQSKALVAERTRLEQQAKSK